jgi:hypothetical protein
MIGSISDQSAFKARFSEPCKAISVSTHHDDPRSHAQIEISVTDRCKGLTFNRTHSQRTNAYKSARGSWLTSLIISYTFYTCSITYKKVRGSRLTLHIASTTSSMRIGAYKKQGAPDQRHIQLLLLSARASLCTKSKGLSINVSCSFYYFQHAHHHVQKVRGSIDMCSRFSIWLTKFSKVFCSSADIVIDGLARPLNPKAHLLVFIGMWGSKWAWDHHLSWSSMSAPIDS